MTDDKSKPHTFSRRIQTYDPYLRGTRNWVPEAEAQEKIAELENTVRLRGARLDGYVEEIERLRESKHAAVRGEMAALQDLLRGEREARARLQRERAPAEDLAERCNLLTDLLRRHKATTTEARAEAARLRALEVRDRALRVALHVLEATRWTQDAAHGVRCAVGVDVGRDVSSVVTLRYRPDNGGTWETVAVRSTEPAPAPEPAPGGAL